MQGGKRVQPVSTAQRFCSTALRPLAGTVIPSPSLPPPSHAGQGGGRPAASFSWPAARPRPPSRPVGRGVGRGERGALLLPRPHPNGFAPPLPSSLFTSPPPTHPPHTTPPHREPAPPPAPAGEHGHGTAPFQSTPSLTPPLASRTRTHTGQKTRNKPTAAAEASSTAPAHRPPTSP